MISKYARGWSNSHKHPQAMTLKQLNCSHPNGELVNTVSGTRAKCMFCDYITPEKV